MTEADARGSWTRHFVYRSERLRTTWKLRLGLLLALGLGLWLTSESWTAAVGRSLVCEATVAPSDAIVIENFDPDYLLFERARQLRQDRVAQRVFVPVHTDPGSVRPNDVSVGIVHVMATISGLGEVEIIPTVLREPITLNTGQDVLRFLRRERIRSVIVLSPLFRSRRSALVYDATIGRAGIALRCVPVAGSRGVHNWTRSWHGIQEVLEQWAKLIYYRGWVLRAASQDAVRSPGS
jgi:hypothetical protein